MSHRPAEAHAPAFSRASATARRNAWGPYHGLPGETGWQGGARLRTRRRGVLLRLDRRKHQTRGPGVDTHPGAVPDLAGDDLLREARLHLLLDGAAKRTGPVDRVVAALGQMLLGAVGEVERQVPVGQASLEPRELEVDDLAHVGARQRVEDDDVVDAVQELGPEVLAERVQDALAHGLVSAGVAGDHLAPDVGGHDDDRVLAVDGPPLAVVQPAIV